MITKLIEATNTNKFNFGKFLVGRFDEAERRRRSVLTDESDDQLGIDRTRYSLIGLSYKTGDETLVLDLQTGEGVLLPPRRAWPRSEHRRAAFVHEVLNRHKVWVCPLYEPFLAWLMGQDVSDLNALPDVVRTLPDEACDLAGYRRPGQAMNDELQTAVLATLAGAANGAELRHEIEQRIGRTLVESVTTTVQTATAGRSLRRRR